MTEPKKEPTPQDIKDAEASMLCDCIQRLSAGRQLDVVVTAFASAIYNMASDVIPANRDFISGNLVQLANDILAIDTPPEVNTQTALPLND